jgi:RES domain-containing protein
MHQPLRLLSKADVRAADPIWPLRGLSSRLYRIVFAQHADAVLNGVIHHEGRFHHDGQAALYASPTPETAAIAIDIYLKPGDPDRLMVPLELSDAHVADLRDPATCAALAIDPIWPGVPWADERALGRCATSWRASDAARAAGADGMIYASRRAPKRWHVVLFDWNKPGRARLDSVSRGVRWMPNGPSTT